MIEKICGRKAIKIKSLRNYLLTYVSFYFIIGRYIFRIISNNPVGHATVDYKEKTDWLKNAKHKAIELNLTFSELAMKAIDAYKPMYSKTGLDVYLSRKPEFPTDMRNIQKIIEYCNNLTRIREIEGCCKKIMKKVDHQRLVIEDERRSNKAS